MDYTYDQSQVDLARAVIVKLKEYESDPQSTAHYTYYLDSPDGVQALAQAFSDLNVGEVKVLPSKRSGSGG